jgi:hypothetical protein
MYFLLVEYTDDPTQLENDGLGPFIAETASPGGGVTSETMQAMQTCTGNPDNVVDVSATNGPTAVTSAMMTLLSAAMANAGHFTQ